MKKIFLVAAVVAAPAPAFAADDTKALDAFISASVGYQDSGNNVGAPENDDIAFALRASASVPLSNSIGLQADLGYSHAPLNYPIPYDANLKSTDIATHLFYRNPDKFLVGVIGQANFNTLSVYTVNIDTKQYFIGGEAQAYLNNVTLYGQLAYRKDDLGITDIDMDGVTATAQAKYFVNSNWSLALKGEYSALKLNGPDIDVDQWRIGVGSERRLSSVPVSLFAKLDYGENKFDSAKFHDTRLMAGVKINFGSHTLEEREHSGASLDPFTAENPLLPIS